MGAREPLKNIPSATVVLLRDGEASAEVLLLRKSASGFYGGVWVFPGGRIEPDDWTPGSDGEMAARQAAVRETREEAGVDLDPAELVQISHWKPSSVARVRFEASFFVALETEEAVRVDGHEIIDHRWLLPADAFERHARREMELSLPTWLTLYHVMRHGRPDAVLDHFASREPRHYTTHPAQRADGVHVALWEGDAGYEDWDADRDGPRHRLVMPETGGFTFENDVAEY
ncbi:MAG: NUDIX hydrolase [Gammaproteobacteria bacterium]|nr:NUDIX hydrolase [Gammaproteobacteria bacterium]